MELTVDGLAAFVRRQGGDLTPRLGLDLATWRSLATGHLNLDLLRALHRALIGVEPTVRRAGRDGLWGIAPARPGVLRSGAQSFRAGDHVEAAWDPGALRSGLTRLLREVDAGFAADPIGQAAHLVWALCRAQPFTGMNERVALAMASWCLRRAGLPPLPPIEREPAFTAAVRAADRAALELVIAGGLWDEALTLVERPNPPRSTLMEEHLELAEARRRAPRLSVDEIESIADRAAGFATERLGTEPRPRCWLASQLERLQECWDSAARGRAICPHDPILVQSWSAPSGLAARLVLASAGRGASGAVSAHLALHLAGVPSGPAPGLLLIPDQGDVERSQRIAAWSATLSYGG